MRSRFPNGTTPAAVTIALAAAVAVFAGRAPAQPTTSRNGTAKVTHVTVKMIEYQFVLKVHKVPTGTVVFTVVNSGQLPHTFKIQRLQKVTPLIQPGHRYVMRVTFRKPGKYYYLCTVGAHVQYGMYGTLTVAST
jgi:plastocyanin